MNRIIELQIKDMDLREHARVQEILEALIDSGGMFGVKSGQTLLHFDKYGGFMGIELRYWPWRNRIVS